MSAAPYLVVGGASGKVSLFDINQQKVIFESEPVAQNEVTKIFYHEQQVVVLNADQQMMMYELKKAKEGLKLKNKETKCLYLDEIIDVKVIKNSLDYADTPKHAILCSNNELIKVVDLETGMSE